MNQNQKLILFSILTLGIYYLVVKKEEIRKNKIAYGLANASTLGIFALSYNRNNDKDTKVSKWVKIGLISALATLVTIMIILSLYYLFSSISGKTWDEWYVADKNKWLHDAGIANEKDFKWANVPSGWRATFLISIIGSIITITLLGAWISGAKWINKTNTRVKGQVYVRNFYQNLVFRALVLIFGFSLIVSFALEVTGDVISYMDGDGGNVINGYWNYIQGGKHVNVATGNLYDDGGPGNWYYQCFLSSLFIGFAAVTRRYNWMPVLLPMAFIGAVRTWIDPSDWVEKASWQSVYFNRFVFIHIAIVLLPIFIMIATRQYYSFNKMLTTMKYTFMMAFMAYVFQNIGSLNNNGKVEGVGYGELAGIADVFKLNEGTGLDAKHWVAQHIHYFFWLIFVPFGLALFVFIVLTTNTFYYLANKSEFKKSMRRNLAILKLGKTYKFFTGNMRSKTYRQVHGQEVNAPKGKYILEAGILYVPETKKDFELVNFEVK